MIERRGHELAAPIADGAFYAGDPFPHYERLRREAPVSWCAPGGHWVAASHEAVHHVSTHPDDFCSAQGILTMEIDVSYDSPPTMMHTDPPEHTRYRKLVAPGFRPSVVKSLSGRVRERCEAAFDAFPTTDFDIVSSLSVPMPLLLIADVLGVSTDDLDRFYEWSEAAIPGNVDISPDEQARLMGECWTYLLDVCTQRREQPADDIVSILAHTELDGRRLRDDELVMFLNQLLIAGNETTRNAISGAVEAFARFPDQFDRIRRDPSLFSTAVEEILRWTTPVISFLRTTTRPTSLCGVDLGPGEPVLMLYQSANRDEAAFGPSADVFDVGRQPNPHLSFGFGSHFCIGAALARLELTTVLSLLVERVSRIELVGSVERTSSTVIAGVRSLPVRLHALRHRRGVGPSPRAR